LPGEEKQLKSLSIQWRGRGLKRILSMPTALRRRTTDKSLNLTQYLPQKDLDLGTEFCLRMTAMYRSLAITEDGYFALVPHLTQVGDQIGLFEGGKVPLVIRQQGEHWQLVGDSYVHGIMRGRLLKKAIAS
jgi:hypothetical protein